MELRLGADPGVVDTELHDLLRRDDTDLLPLAPGAHLPDPTVTACYADALAAPDSVRGAVERLAVERARAVFDVPEADARPRTGQRALSAVLAAWAGPLATVLDARLNTWRRPSPPHTHVVEHLLARDDRFDYEALARTAERVRPAVLLCGGEPYPSTPDFARLRVIADSVGARLVADISAIAGAVAVGAVPNPVEHSHAAVTCTRSHLPGLPGGLILGTRLDSADADTATVAATACLLDVVRHETYREQVWRTVAGTAELAAELARLGHQVVPTEPDNHVVHVALSGRPDALPGCHLATGAVPGRPDLVAIDLTAAGQRGIGRGEARSVAAAVDAAARADGPATTASTREAVQRLLWRFPLPRNLPASRRRTTP